MTDTAHRLSDAQLDAIASLDVHLDDEAAVLAADRDRAEDAAIERYRRGELPADRITALEADLEWTQRQREAAEAAQAIAEEARQAEADRADAERDRADGAEAHARALLAEVVWRQAAERGDDPDVIPAHALDAIVDSLWDDLEGGVKADDLNATPHLIAWEEGR